MAKTITGNDDDIRMDGFVAHNNVWNAGGMQNGNTYSQSITVPNTHDPAGTTIKWSFPDGNPSEDRWWEAPWDKFPVLSYPTLTAGRDTWEDYDTTNKEFPVQVKDVKDLEVDFDYDLGKNPEGHNVAFSLWTKPDPNAVGQNIQDEVMVWVHTGWFSPDGKETGVFSDGMGSAHIFHEPEADNSVGRTWDYTAVQYDKDIQSGKLDLGGTAADGLYHVRVTAKDKTGAALKAATVVTDTVKEVRNADGTTQFVLKGGATVSGTDILSAS